MPAFFPTFLRTELLVFSLALITLGLAGKGFFLRGYSRRRRSAFLFLLVFLIILFFMAVTAGQLCQPLRVAEGLLIRPVIAWGKLLAGWLPGKAETIEQIALIFIVVIALPLFAFKKKPALPFLLLLFSGGAALIGGIYLSRGQISWAILFLALACLYAWLSGLVSRKIITVHPPLLFEGTTGVILLALIVLAGFFLRSYELGLVSFRFDHYESDYGSQALKILSGRHNIYLWNSIGWRGLGHLNFSPVYIYCVALFFRVFGPTLVTLKLVAVTWGLLGILLTYGIVNTLFGKRLALITAFFLAVSPLHINYSRIGLLLCSTLTMGLLIIYFLLRAVLRRDFLSYIFLGITVSFAGYFYSPIRYPVLLSGFLIIFQIVFKRRFFRRHWFGLVLLVLTVSLITLGLNLPTLGLIAPRFAGYESVWHRTKDHLHTDQADYIRAIPLIWENFQKLVRSLFIDRSFNYDPWPRGNLYFNPVIPVLMLLGISYSLANIKKVNYRLLLFFSAAFLLPNLLSRPPVMVRRTMLAWPFLYCLAAIPLSQLLLKTRELFRKATSGLILSLAVIALLYLGAYNSNVFFSSQQPAGRWEEERYFDEYAKGLLENYYLYLVPHNQLSRKTIDFLLEEKKQPGRSRYEYLSPGRLGELNREEIAGRLPAAFVCAPSRVGRSELEKLKQKLKHGVIAEYRNKSGRLIAYSLLLEAGETGGK